MIEDWEGKFGDEYTERNDYDWKKRKLSWKKILPEKDLTILEVGSNRGKNLACLWSLHHAVMGLEPNAKTIELVDDLRYPTVWGRAQYIPFINDYFDLVFTCGVLMHIPDSELPQAMSEIWRVANRYVLAIEYQGKGEEVEYRGKKNMLWKRKEYRYPGTLVKEGDLGKEFDNCHYWLYKK